MAKVQPKRSAGSSKKSSAKRPVARPKSAAPAKKSSATKAGARKAAKPARTQKKSSRPSPKPVTPKKKTTRPAADAKPAKQPVKRGKHAAAPAKAAPKAGGRAAAAAKTAAKPGARVVAVAVAAPIVARAAQAVAARVAPVVAEKKRARRSRPRVQSSGVAVANWFVQDKPRPSSFIPAPARAEAPSLIAAPPASSDRLIRPEDLNQQALRTVPVRVDLEQSGGKVFISVNPQELNLRAGEGIEWDFRYLGGADVLVDDVVIEFDRPSPFSAAHYRSRKPGSARPHRQLSTGALPSAAGKRLQYTIRAINAFRTELAQTKTWVNVLA